MTDLIVPKGTQVVLLNDVKIINELRFHTKGSVGVIDQDPSDAFHAYKIKFTDNSVGMASRREIAVKKHFQNDQSGSSHQMDNFDLFDHVIYKCIVGSRAFGLDNENSDTDVRGIYLPSAEIHWSMFGIPEQIENKETEECYWELQKFIVLALKANPNILECLYTPMVEYADDTANKLLSIRESFLSKLVYQTYNGYVLSQFKKLEQDLRNQGSIKLKHAMHLIRLLLQGIELMEYGTLTVRVDKFKNDLLDIKFGHMPWEKVDVWRLALHKDFEYAFSRTKLPERPDYNKANDLLIEARMSKVNFVKSKIKKKK